MESPFQKVQVVRQGLTEVTEKLIKIGSTDEVISEVMQLRGYITSPYHDQLRATLKEIGLFKLEFTLSDLGLLGIKLSQEEIDLYGLADRNGNYLLKGRYVVPIRNIVGQVTALVGWYPDIKKYVTTPTYGFSKNGQFFNAECFEKSFIGDYPSSEGESGKGLVYLVEGIFDTLSLRALGFPVLGNMGLDMSMAKVFMLTRFGKVVAIPDNDSAGRGTNKYLSSVSGKRKKLEWNIQNEHVIVQLPEGVKDVDDLIKGYYCLDDLIACQSKRTRTKLIIE